MGVDAAKSNSEWKTQVASWWRDTNGLVSIKFLDKLTVFQHFYGKWSRLVGHVFIYGCMSFVSQRAWKPRVNCHSSANLRNKLHSLGFFSNPLETPTHVDANNLKHPETSLIAPGSTSQRLDPISEEKKKNDVRRKKIMIEKQYRRKRDKDQPKAPPT